MALVEAVIGVERFHTFGNGRYVFILTGDCATVLASAIIIVRTTVTYFITEVRDSSRGAAA